MKTNLASEEAQTGERRTLDQLRQHYEVERELSDRLRKAARQERRRLYTAVYEELYRRVPLHPQLTRKKSLEETEQATALQMKFLRRFLKPDCTFMEVGAGDCALSFAVAPAAKKVYAIDVSPEITKSGRQPDNFSLILSDGCTIDLPAGSVQVAYSNQLMEHLHPEDALEQLQNIYRALAPGGCYVCITPNRLNGPHDISKHFDRVPSGFHLREYTVSELSDLFRKVGFSKVTAYAAVKGNYFPLPIFLLRAFETVLGSLPYSLRRAIGTHLPGRLLLDIRLVGTK